MRIVFINRFYWPDEQATAQLLTDLAEALAHRGHGVTVIASGSDRPGGSASAEHNAVSVVRVAPGRSGRPGLAAKAWDSLRFFAGAAWSLVRLLRPGDVVITLTDPPLFSVAAAVVAGLRRARLIHWIQDIHPEVLAAVTGARAALILRPVRDAAWRAADSCVVLGADMAGLAAERGVDPARLRVIPNWPPAGLTEPDSSRVETVREERGLAGKFVVLYSGNLGRVHDMASLIGLAEQLRTDPHVVILIIGHGPQKPFLQTQTRARGLSNVVFLPPQPRAALSESLALGHLHVVTLKTGCERLVYPSKIYGIAAVGRSLLFIGPRGCDVALTIESDGLGRAFSPAELAQAASYVAVMSTQPQVLAEASRKAAEASSRHGGFARALARWDEILSSEELAGKGGTL